MSPTGSPYDFAAQRLFLEKRNHSLGLIVIFLTVHVYLFWHYGLRTLYDAQAYIAAADRLLEHGSLQDAQQIFYIAHIGLLSLFRALFPHQIVPYLIFQCVVSALAVIALFRSADKLWGSYAGVFAALIYMLWIDNIQWNTVAMTESLMQSAGCILIYILVNVTNTRRKIFLSTLMLMSVILLRPTGIILILATAGFFLLTYKNFIVNRQALKIGIPFVLLLISYFSARYMFTHWDFTEQYKKGNIVTYMDGSEGTPLHAPNMRHETKGLTFADDDLHPMEKIFSFAVANPLHFIKIASLKIWYLMMGIRPYYSISHNIYLVVWLVTVYSMAIMGWRNLNNKPVKGFVLSTVVINCLLIGISTIDWDNRFYIPMAPGIVLLAGGGAAHFLTMISKSTGFRAE